jgi:hypothetical protein
MTKQLFQGYSNEIRNFARAGISIIEDSTSLCDLVFSSLHSKKRIFAQESSISVFENGVETCWVSKISESLTNSGARSFVFVVSEKCPAVSCDREFLALLLKELTIVAAQHSWFVFGFESENNREIPRSIAEVKGLYATTYSKIEVD